MLLNVETGKIEEIQFRADLRENDLKFLQEMTALANKYDWLLMDVKGNLANPEIEEIIKLIKISNAYNFVKDPMNFLTELDEGKIEIE
jgi:hypothetical protein